MRKNKKKFVLIALLFLTVFMGIGYSILQQQLKIEGTATVKTNFDVQIVGIERYNNAGTSIRPEVGSPWVVMAKNAKEISEPTFTATTATFNVRLEPMSEITYRVDIQNKGSIPAIFDPVVIEETGNTDVEIETLVDLDDKWLDLYETVSYLVTLRYDVAESNETSKGVTVTFNAKQAPAYGSGYDRVFPTILFNENPKIDPASDFYLIDLLNENTAIGIEPVVYASVDGGDYEAAKSGVVVNNENNAGNYYFENGNSLHYYPSANLGSGEHTIRIKVVYEGGAGESNVLTLKHYVQ